MSLFSKKGADPLQQTQQQRARLEAAAAAAHGRASRDRIARDRAVRRARDSAEMEKAARDRVKAFNRIHAKPSTKTRKPRPTKAPPKHRVKLKAAPSKARAAASPPPAAKPAPAPKAAVVPLATARAAATTLTGTHGRFTQAQLAQALQIPEATAGPVLARLQASGAVTPHRSGGYVSK